MSKNDYKNTVNLPKTDFPMRANLTKNEPETVQRWEDQHLYQKMRDRSTDKPKFVLHDGPPYANGELHAGTALNKIIKDIVVRSKQKAGFDSPYVPGWDCHGLPIEHKVMSELGSKAKELSQVEIRQNCRAFALKYVDLHRKGFKSILVSADWDNPYLTLSPEYVATGIRVFAEMYEKGNIYKGLKPIYWCSQCQTALAEAEVEYDNHTSPSIYVKFEAVDPIPGLEGKVSYVIWTTTPWTLPANLAISLHPDFEYAAYRVGDETLIMAEQLASSVMEASGVADYETVTTFKGQELEGLTYRHIIFEDRVSPIILGEHVTLEAGTGCVHTAPGHGQDDYVVGARYGIEPLSPVDGKGEFTSDGGPYKGMKVFDANKTIVSDLMESGHMLHASHFEHSYPHCWRCKNPVIYRSTPQWFISMSENNLREEAMNAVEQVSWIPDWGQERMRSMIEQRPDWCISRQRAWGVPIPVLYCSDCQEPHANAETFKLVEEIALSADDGIDRWFSDDLDSFVPSGSKCTHCNGSNFEKETDILDVWFDSGVSNRAVLDKREELTWPADMYLEGSDQHRGWFQSSLLPAVALRGEPPYRCVVTHGYVVDGNGRKLSKSLGNFQELPVMLKKTGAEIIRLWVAGENYRQDIRLSGEIMTQMQESYRRIRNTIRYGLSNISDFSPADAVPYDELEDVDKWALHKMQDLRQRVLQSYSTYDFHQVYHAVINFCSGELSSFYFDVLKDRLYTYAPDSRERRAAQTVLTEITTDLLKLLAPILAHTCDEAWQYLPEEFQEDESVHLVEFPEANPEHVLTGELLSTWDELLRMRSVISKVLEEMRSNKEIGSSLEADLILTPGSDAVENILQTYADQLPSVFIVSTCTVAPQSEESVGNEDKLLVHAEKAKGKKCARCWNFRDSVGSVEEHIDICGRCAEQLGVTI